MKNNNDLTEQKLSIILNIFLWGFIILIFYLWIYPKYINYQKNKNIFFDIEKIEHLGYLATYEIKLSDLYESQKIIEKNIIFHDRKIRGFIVFNGEAKIGIDFNNITVKKVDKEKKEVELILPEAEIIYLKINGKNKPCKNKDNDEPCGMYISWENLTTQEKSNFMTSARASSKKNMTIELTKDKILMNKAKKRAQILIKNFYKKLGWQVIFTSNYSIRR